MEMQVRWLFSRMLSLAPGTAGDALPRALVRAAAAGNEPRLRMLLEGQGQHPEMGRANAPCADGQTALEAAANGGHTACVRILLLDFHAQDRAGRAALRQAACRRCDECCTCKHNNGAFAMHCGCLCLRTLQPMPAFKSALDGENAGAALALSAAATKRLSDIAWFSDQARPACIAAMLTVAGLDPNAPDPNLAVIGSPFYLCSPLFQAARWGHTTGLSTLLAAPGIDVNSPDAEFLSPLCIAALEGHAACVEALLAAPGIDARWNITLQVSRRLLVAFCGGGPFQIYWILVLFTSLVRPSALHAASDACVPRMLFLDFEAVADSARCIRMLLAASPRRRHLGLLATCW